MVGQVGRIGYPGRIGLSSVQGVEAFNGLALDFVNGRYALDNPYSATFPTGWSFSRTGEGTALDTLNRLVPFATGVPRITDRGLLIEEGRTNLVSLRNANPIDTSGVGTGGSDPAAVLSIVNDAAALSAAGLSQVATSGNVWKLDNTLGTDFAEFLFYPPSGTGLALTMSAYVRGSGSALFQQAAFASPVIRASAPLPASYTRWDGSWTTPSTNQIRIRITAGSVLYVILPQVEAGAFATSPIITTGAAATRGEEIAGVTGLSSLLSGSFTAAVEVELLGATAEIQRFFDVSVTGSNRLTFNRTGGGNVTSTTVSGGSTATASLVLARNGARILKGATAVQPASFNTAIDGVIGTASTAPAPVGMTSVHLGMRNIGTGERLNGYVRRFSLRPYADTDAQLQALTA